MSSTNTESGAASCHEGGAATPPHDHHAHHHDQAGNAGLQEFIIEGAGCASCVGKIESALKVARC